MITTGASGPSPPGPVVLVPASATLFLPVLRPRSAREPLRVSRSVSPGPCLPVRVSRSVSPGRAPRLWPPGSGTGKHRTDGPSPPRRPASSGAVRPGPRIVGARTVVARCAGPDTQGSGDRDVREGEQGVPGQAGRGEGEYRPLDPGSGDEPRRGQHQGEGAQGVALKRVEVGPAQRHQHHGGGEG